MNWEQYVEEVLQQDYMLNNQNLIEVDKQAAIDAWEKGAAVYINRLQVNQVGEIMNATGGFALIDETQDIEKSEPDNQQESSAYIIKNIELDENNSLDFSNAGLERGNITEQDYYTLYPERDVLEEIFNRISAIGITISNPTDFEVYANTNETFDDAGLHVFFFEESIDIPIPLKEHEKENLWGRINDYEDKLKTNASKPKKTSEKETTNLERN